MITTAEYEFNDEGRAKDLVRQNGWARLISHTSRGLVASHVPIILSDDTEFAVVGHVGRPDEELHELGSSESLLIVEGPHGYVSPGWYEKLPAVPTWNYSAVHLYGVAEILDTTANYQVLTDTVDRYEGVRDDPFLMPQVEEYATRVARGACSFRFRVERWQGKSKLSQDKSVDVASRIVAHLAVDPHYANPELAQAMISEWSSRGIDITG